MTKTQPIIFVTGTGTHVGKTHVAKLLVYGWKCNYWKPIQTGIESDCGDTSTMINYPIGKWITQAFKPTYDLIKPLSPLEAMEYEPQSIDIKLEDFSIPNGSEKLPLIIEGAGGVCVPITKRLEMTTNLIMHLANSTQRPFYVIVVANSGLGTLNHTLLTWDYLEKRIPRKNLLGCVLNGKENPGNRKILEQFGVNIITEIPVCENNEMNLKVMNHLPSLESVTNNEV